MMTQLLYKKLLLRMKLRIQILNQGRNIYLMIHHQCYDQCSCFKQMIQNNLFNTTSYLMNNYYFAKYSNQEVLINLKEGTKEVRIYYDTLLDRLYHAKRKPVLMRPPFQWAQNLHFIFIEVKYAYRHDVAGCSTLFNQSIVANETSIMITASCMEQDNYLLFEVSFDFWAPVNETSLKWEYQAVGKHYIQIEKATKPARWRTLHKEGTTKPPMMKLWFEKHQKFHYQLYEFEDDEIEDFEGWELIENPEEQDQNDMAWLFPQKGPGAYRDLAKKKTKKGKGKGKGKKGAKKTKKTQ
eukprot:403357623